MPGLGVRLIVGIRLLGFGLLLEKLAQLVLDGIFANKAANEGGALFQDIGIWIHLIQRFFSDNSANRFINNTHIDLHRAKANHFAVIAYRKRAQALRPIFDRGPVST